MTDSRKLPIGAIVRRADGSEWRKDEHGADFTQLKAKDVSNTKLPPALPSHTPPPASEGWQAVRKAMKLDGHLPDATVHPSKVQFDLEGNTDTKPVLTWHDNTGRRRHSYTEEFHRQRALHLKDEVHKAKDNLEAAHVVLQEGLRATSGTDTGDAYAAALTHLHTGHRVRDLLKMKGAHAAIHGGTNIEPEHECECEGCDDCSEWHPEDEEDTGEELEKAEWSAAKVNDLPDSAFLYIEPGGEKDEDGKTKPRSLRHLPYRDENGKVDLPHLRNALARLAGTHIPASVKDSIRTRAEKLLAAKIEKAQRKGIPDAYNKPRRIRQGEPGYGKKKFVVNARNAQGKTRVIRFGDANLEIKRDDPKRRANFRARHNCASAKDRLSAKYWSCRQWRHKAKVEASLSGGDDLHKSWSSSPHPDRVHLMMAHPAGHLYQSEVVDGHVADHIMMRDQDDAGPLFRTTEAKVRKALKKAGVHEVPEHVVRHHAVTKMASDMLSKMPEVDLSIPGNLDVVKAHVMKASDEIGKRFGHGSAPSGMSHVPPHVVAAYIQHSNGHALWPKVFQKMEKSWSSTDEDAASLNRATGTTSANRRTEATSSTPQTSQESVKIASPSLQPSPTIRGRKWQEVADEVERTLNKGYSVRLAPTCDDKPPRYFAKSAVEVEEWDVVPGVRFLSDGHMFDVIEDGAVRIDNDHVVYPTAKEVAQAIATGNTSVIEKAPRMRPVMEMDPQVLIDTKLVPKKKQNTKAERAKRGYLNRAVKLLRMARKGDSVALKELQGVVGMMLAHPMEQSFRTDTVNVTKGARGPSGEPIGTVRTHADGSRWEKREDGWHELGEGKRDKKDDKDDGDMTATRSVGHNQALKTLQVLRRKIASTADERERARLKKQIAIIRRRIAVYTRDETAGMERRGNEPKIKDTEKSFAIDMHRHLHSVIAKSKAMSPHEAIAEIVMGDDSLAQSEVRSLKSMVGDGMMDVIKTWMRG